MATVVDTIKIRRSYTPGYRPPLDINDNRRLTDGELFINFPDAVIQVGRKAGAPLEFSLAQSALPNPATIPAQSGLEAGVEPRWHLNGPFLCFG